jgi:integron integrase
VILVREPDPPGHRPPRLLDWLREAIRARHYSRRTEKAYIQWIKRYIFFHGKRHRAEMGAPEVTKFLTSLAVDGGVAASTQNQALSALLFLYRDVLAVDLPWLDGVVRAKRPERLPVVLSRAEVRAVLQRLDGVPRLMAGLLYGAGLRVLECCRLRVQGVDFATTQITVRGGKGDKDRVTLLPAVVKGDLAQYLMVVRAQHQEDLAQGAGWVELPAALLRKYPNAGREWGWQWIFPATSIYRDRVTGQLRRHHLHESVLQRGEARRAPGRDQQARHAPHAQALVRHPPARRRPRHPHGAGAAGAPRRDHHTDLYLRPESRPGRGTQPGRPNVRLVTTPAALRPKRIGIRTRIHVGYPAGTGVCFSPECFEMMRQN